VTRAALLLLVLALAACSRAPDIRTAPASAEALCLAAVQEAAGTETVAVASSGVRVQGGTAVTVAVGDVGARWRCIAGDDGAARGVMPLR
jgi:hypothetical protein